MGNRKLKTASEPSSFAAKIAPAAHVYDLEGYDPRKGAGFLINQVRCELLSALDAELASDGRIATFGLSAAQFIIIATLATMESDSSVSCTDLCRRVTYDGGGMTRMLDRLESKGLIRRHRCTGDRRVVYIELTEQGRMAFPCMREISMGVLNRFLNGFAKSEVRQLECYLTRILRNARSTLDAVG